MDETVVYNLGDPKTGSSQPVFQAVQFLPGFHADGNMIEDKGPFHRSSVVLQLRFLHLVPLKKGDHVLGAYLKKIVSETRLSQSRNHAHAQKVAPKPDGGVKVSRGHGQVIDAGKCHAGSFACDCSAPLFAGPGAGSQVRAGLTTIVAWGWPKANRPRRQRPSGAGL